MQVLIPISKITVNAGRREAFPKDVQELADSISEIGLLSPITVDSTYTLIAGLHRLEAAKLLGWSEIECKVSDLDGLLAQLAEVDENFVHADLSPVDYGNLLLRRKEIYETLHPESKNGGDRRSKDFRTKNFRSDSVKSFSQDTAEKLGVTQRTVEMQVQMAKNLTPEAKAIIREADAKISKTDTLKLSKLEPEQQSEAASRLMNGTIHSVDEYLRLQTEPAPVVLEPTESQPPIEASLPVPIVPYRINSRHFASFEESVADLKNPNKDCSYTPDSLLAELDSFIRKFQKEFAWYSDPFCTVVFPDISSLQYEYLKQRLGTISATLHDFLKQVKRSMKK